MCGSIVRSFNFKPKLKSQNNIKFLSCLFNINHILQSSQIIVIVLTISKLEYSNDLNCSNTSQLHARLF